MKIIITFFLLSISFLQPSFAVETDSSPAAATSVAPVVPQTIPANDVSYIMCKSKSVVRTVRIDAKKSGCVTTYTKEGKDSVVGKSRDLDTCRTVFDKIRGNLEKADWACRDISSARLSFSE